MIIFKIFQIEFSLFIATIPLFFLIQNKSKKSPPDKYLSKENQLKKIICKLPTLEKLLKLEEIAIDNGSGIEFDSLLGEWNFISVWRKVIYKEDSVFSSLLRFFSANIELKRNASSLNQYEFLMSSSIKFGLISIKFSGPGYLKGQQPLLHFFFNLVELKSGSSTLLKQTLKEPVKKEKSFFALIGSNESEGWLSVRGQGGNLILLMKT